MSNYALCRTSLLFEAVGTPPIDGSPQVDMGDYHKALASWSSELFPEDPKKAAVYAERLAGQTARAAYKTAQRLHKLIKNRPDWAGSKVTVAPHFDYNERRPWESDMHQPITGVQVHVHHPAEAKEDRHLETPAFTYWPWERANHSRESRRTQKRLGWGSGFRRPGQERVGKVDDILQAGDSDFFHEKHPGTQSDYFHLVNGLRTGAPREKSARPITLYTARPAVDRHLYADATHLPRNLFLTSHLGDAAGIGHDFGKRDVWKVRIDPKHLVQTLEGPTSHYQIVGGKGPVPIHSITPMSLHDEEIGLSRAGLLFTEMDDELRRAERNASRGDPQDIARHFTAHVRAGGEPREFFARELEDYHRAHDDYRQADRDRNIAGQGSTAYHRANAAAATARRHAAWANMEVTGKVLAAKAHAVDHPVGQYLDAGRADSRIPTWSLHMALHHVSHNPTVKPPFLGYGAGLLNSGQHWMNSDEKSARHLAHALTAHGLHTNMRRSELDPTTIITDVVR